MTAASKLRVATADAPDALDLMKVGVETATGFAVEPQFQEIDCGDLVVEMRLTDSQAAAPQLVARAIERSACGIEVLSTWKEASPTRAPAPVSSGQVFDVLEGPLPKVARRALLDDIPTAQWRGRAGGAARADRSYWQLAVPVVRSDGQSIVGVHRRQGYSLRFGVHDAGAVREGLTS